MLTQRFICVISADPAVFSDLLRRLNKFLQYLMEAGFRVSRTHFDPTGVRTDATLQQFQSVLSKYSVPTYTNAATATQLSVSSTMAP